MPQRLLVVDDDADVRDINCCTLEASGYEASLASGGRQAVERLEQEAPDLVSADVAMPGQGRVEPEVFLDMACRLGARSILRKPFTRAEMLHAVEQALNPCSRHPTKETPCPLT